MRQADPQPLPALRAPLDAAAIVDRLSTASRRGKLPGFRATPEDPASPFVIEVFGKYIHRRMLVSLEAQPADHATVLRFRTRLRRTPIAVFWIVVVLSVWPGVALTDSLLATYFSWYPREFWVTCAWYLPLAVIPIPWMWRTIWRQSAAIADAEARESIAKIATHLGAGPVGTP